MTHMVNETAAAYGAKAKVTFRQMVPPTINDPASSELAHRVGAELVGEDNVVLMEKTMAGEDFAYYLEEKPGCFAFFGIANPEIDAVHSHHSNFFKLMNEHCQSAPPCTHSMRCSGWKNMPNNMTK